ncbi:MAG: nucleotidyl transferase AbiEii/AbiGii toxin family protein [Nitrospinae bacterium]|nr:nucleotidyl transferase AbiEii/AbiGii toxin family protein [Nitrospinota bacterium]
MSGVRTIAPERTYWEKLLLLHGLYYGHENGKRLPSDRDLISRHYYDAAMITAAETGMQALENIDLLDAVREHNLIAFRQAWKQFDKAIPGSVRLAPQPELRSPIERDYRTMQGMLLGDVPDFEWIMEQLQSAEAMIHQS